jgi:hypothetical protein
MTTKFRTLWLLGFIGLCAPVAGCVAERHEGGHGSGGSGAGACLDNQFFEVQWGIDHGEQTLSLACNDIRNMGSGVVLLTNAAPPYDRLPVSYYITCVDGATCTESGGLACNMDGVTTSHVPVGTAIIEADLVRPDGTVLSSAVIDPVDAPLYSIYSCDYSIAPFVFTIAL